MAVCGLFLRLGISRSHKTLEQNFIFQIGTLYPHGIKFILIFLVNMFKPIPWLNFLQTNNYITYNFSICSSEGLALETSALKLFKFTLSTPLIIPNYLVTLYHRSSNTVSLEIYPLSSFDLLIIDHNTFVELNSRVNHKLATKSMHLIKSAFLFSVKWNFRKCAYVRRLCQKLVETKTNFHISVLLYLILVSLNEVGLLN